MIAVYEFARTLYVLDVESDEFSDFFNLLESKKEYPFPDSEILFIEDDKVINRFDPK